MWELWGRALSGEPVTVTAEVDVREGRRGFHEMRFNTLRDALGERIGAYQFVYDVTERVGEQQRLARAEEQLHQSQKMEAIGQLTGGVAHDFNNLLSPITGVLDMVRRRYGDDPRTARLTDGALQAAERAKTLVQRLLVFARRQRLETRAVDVAALIEGMRELIVSSIGPGIELRVIEPDRPVAATADPNQLELALLNLAVNARDAMPRGGRLTIAVEAVSIEPGETAPAPAGPYVRISVTDTGVGMDKATLRRAVEPFYSTKGLGKGTGLGLSMVHGLAGQLGGAFTLTSEPGRGASAVLYLPAAASPPPVAAAPARETASPARGRSLTILLVDDEDSVRAGAAEMLRELGHVVIEAAGGAEALTKLEGDAAVDVLITDYMMPSIDGAELARRARERRPDLRGAGDHRIRRRGPRGELAEDGPARQALPSGGPRPGPRLAVRSGRRGGGLPSGLLKRRRAGSVIPDHPRSILPIPPAHRGDQLGAVVADAVLEDDLDLLDVGDAARRDRPSTTTRSASLPGAMRADPAGEAEVGRAVQGGDPDRLDRREASLDQQLDLALVAEAGHDAAIAGRIRPGEQQAAGGDELPLQAQVVAHRPSRTRGAGVIAALVARVEIGLARLGRHRLHGAGLQRRARRATRCSNTGRVEVTATWCATSSAISASACRAARLHRQQRRRCRRSWGSDPAACRDRAAC